MIPITTTLPMSAANAPIAIRQAQNILPEDRTGTIVITYLSLRERGGSLIDRRRFL
jgi:hypothetical protein